jgi:hypothetical protein
MAVNPLDIAEIERWGGQSQRSGECPADGVPTIWQ